MIWDSKRPASQHIREITQSHKYQILTHYISDSVTLDTAIAEIQAPLTKALAQTSDPDEFNKFIETELSSTWKALLLLITKTPRDSTTQDKLLNLLSALSSQPPLTSKDQTPVLLNWGDKASKVWSDLPLLGPQLREWWNFPLPDNDGEDVDEDAKAGWINLNAFVARLTAASSVKSNKEGEGRKSMDHSLYAIWALRTALESENAPAGRVYEAWLGAAAVWVIYAGQFLHALCEEGKTDIGRVGRTGDKLKKEGEMVSGFYADRWRFWREELGKVERGGGVRDEVVRELIRRARETMKELSE